MFKFPAGLSRIDAVYERYTDGNILFFSGNKYWITDGNDFKGEPFKTSFLVTLETILQELPQGQ